MTNPTNDLALLTAKEVAELLRVSPRRFEQMIQEGAAPEHIRIGRLRRWQPQSVRNWLKTKLVAAKPTRTNAKS